ncbi:hypothetical protein [Sphingobacterium endophyticum]|uniref:hypothetical protein n=1 Tax=Sphingobacterium endophyticum TaxID=2546448 RepID=UPI0012E2F240|nr:hypothetical protein [Sphingobacterium endophyticum]
MKVRKITGLLCILTAIAVTDGQSQTLREWVRQKATQKRYLVQHIAAQRVYLKLVKDGVNFARSGWGKIQGKKGAEVDLHNRFFNSLCTVSPQVKGYPKIMGILAMQADILAHYAEFRSRTRLHGLTSIQGRKTLESVYPVLLGRCNGLLNDLGAVLREGHLKMDDGQRILAIEEIGGEMYGLLLFSKGILDGSLTLSLLIKQFGSDLQKAEVIFKP